jgi:ABC-type multidrug transport system fused ATPase/permease subunit
MRAAHVSLFMNSVVVFSAFLPIANRDHLLYDTQRIFNTLTLVSIISEPLQSFLQALPQLAMAVGCISRIQAYLLTADHYDPRHYLDSESSSFENDSSLQTEIKAPVNAFVARNGHFGWVEGTPAVLRNVNVSIPAGKLTLIVGPVGSGKTTLLHALLGETVQIRGEVLCLRQAIAFCAQQPWLTNTTARKSIIGHSQEDPAWYERVVEACALHRDFAELEKGDQTAIGSSGAALSGGQKQRMVSFPSLLGGLD